MIKTITLDANRMKTGAEAHSYLKETLSFPEHYGNNLDALHDCLTELGPVRIDIVHRETGSEYFKRLLRVFEDAARVNPDLELIAAEYQLIALDVDGTALNDRKELTPRLIRAIRRAFDAGKEVAFCTGRSLAEMRPLLRELPQMHYLVAESGGCIHDLRKNEILFSQPLSQEALDGLEQIIRGRDVMPYAFGRGNGYAREDQLQRLGHYQMGAYAQLVPYVTTRTEDLFAQLRAGQITADKLNLYHTSPEEREISRQLVEERGVPVLWVYAEKASLECSPPGVHKGFGLRKLSQLTGIPLSAMIMVGDAYNDVEGIRAAGLSVAMGNANEQAMAAADVIVSDNNHDGAAEAIERFLLHE